MAALPGQKQMVLRQTPKMVVLNNGEVCTSGNPESVLTPETIRSVYGVNARVNIGDDGIPQVTPISSVRSMRLA